ncbi:putative ribonuclease H protein [Vitis vinifera]|uniref:Putative ribonuclease H protein n=1 Tax=Vitis vinifera TaxID=29760 RepID=A0A438FCF1_VITVI|nr:putative ribonuclease H protein [Vitis vinifera]
MFEEPQARRPVVASKLLMRIDNMDYEGLEGPILEEEVTKAMSGLGDDKAPRTDGFSLAFWKFFWSIVSGEVMQINRCLDVIEERFKRKLVAWKKQYLSKGDRLVLIKSTLSSLPIYFMPFFVIPKKVNQVRENSKELLWRDTEERRKFHLVNWVEVCKNKKHGGLGLRHLEGLNQAFLGKWLWRFSLERESLWRKVILGKFGEVEGGWITREVVFPQECNSSRCMGKGRGWRWILEVSFGRLFQDWELKEVSQSLEHTTSSKVQEGEDTLIWKNDGKGKYRRLLSKVKNNLLFLAKEAKIALNLVVNNFWVGLGVPGFNEKSSPIIEIQGTGEEENNNLAVGSDLLILVYLGRAQLKDFQR